MSCRYCFYRPASETRENRVMTKETVDTLIQRISEYRPSSLSVSFQGGEPTLAGLDFFRYFVNGVKKNIADPVSYAFQTNGLALDDDFAEFFKKNGFLVGVSLDGGKKTNDRYRLDKNAGSVLPRVLSAINTLEKHGVDFNILAVIDDKNAAEIRDTYRYFKKHGLRFLQFIPYIDEINGISLSPDAYEDFLKASFDLWYDDYTRGEYVSVRHIDNYVGILLGRQPENCAMGGVCGSYFVVEANGDLYPCDFYCKEEFRLGTIFDEEPFAPGKKHADFINRSLIIHERCRGCKYHALCRGGCRRDRTGGYTKNKYCKAYYNFFEYSADRMELIARALTGSY